MSNFRTKRRGKNSHFFSILNLIANAKGNEQLASKAFVASFIKGNDNRISDIYKYVNQHFKKNISLAELAAVVNMTPNSFCRFFKKATNKTPVEYLNETRIKYACQLLVRGELTIAQCAFESGFNNLANFNRRFKLTLGVSPKEYIQRISGTHKLN